MSTAWFIVPNHSYVQLTLLAIDVIRYKDMLNDEQKSAVYMYLEILHNSVCPSVSLSNLFFSLFLSPSSLL